MDEQWKPVPGYEERYEVSDLGRVRRSGAAPGARVGRIIKPRLIQYPCVNLTNGSRASHRTHKVHRLVAAAFLGTCPDGIQVNHLNGDKTDSRLCNLEYVTHRENALHAVRTGLYPFGDRHGWRTKPESLPRGERSGKTHLTDADVLDMRGRFAAGSRAADLAAEFGIAKPTIYAILGRKTWSHI